MNRLFGNCNAIAPSLKDWGSLLVLVLFLCLDLRAQPQMMFAQNEASGPNIDMGYSIARDSFGNTLVTGLFRGVVDFDPGPGVYNMTSTTSPQHDMFIVKLDANQNLVWAKQIGSVDIEYVYAVHTDAAGNIYLYGFYSGTLDFDPGSGVFNMSSFSMVDYNIFILKLTGAGNFIWAKQMTGNTDAWGMCMHMDENGFIYASGYLEGPTDADPGPGVTTIGANGSTSIFIAKYDTSGTFMWAKSMDGAWNNGANSVDVDPNGFIYLTGMFQGPIDFDPGPGNLTYTSTPGGSAYVMKLDQSGNLLWVAPFLGTGSFADAGYCVNADDSGNVYFTGKFEGTVDFDPGPGVYNLVSASLNATDAYVGKMDASGNLIWAFKMGHVDDEVGYSMDIDSLGNILILGMQNSDSTDYDPSSGTYWLTSPGFSFKFFLVKYTPAGVMKCGMLIEKATIGKVMLSQHLVVEGERAYITGGFSNTQDFNPCPPVYNLTSAGATDAFVAAYSFANCSCTMQLTSSSSDVQCNGACDGSASVSLNGGAPPYTYTWLPSGGNSNTASNLCQGTYTCIVTDASGATVSASFTITEPALLSTSISGNNLQCNSSCNGSAAITVSGGSPGYIYAWSNLQNTSSISGLCASTYSVLITDSHGCTSTESITITQPPSLTASASATPTPCNTSNGSVSVSATGGTGLLTYLWQPGGFTTSSVNNLSAGIYTVTITDQNNCTLTLADTVQSIGAPVTSLSSIVHNVCHADSAGTAAITVTGSGPFTYAWSPYGGNASSAINLTAGTYSVLVTDVQGCTQIQTVAITAPTAITALLNTTNDVCSTGSGAIALSPTGGTGPYTYLWSNNQTTSTINGLTGGLYSVSITDANGCSFDTSAIVVSTVAPTLAVASVNNVLCYGDSTASATVSGIGGNLPYTYNWQPFGGNISTAIGLVAGTYSVVVSSSDGCSSTITLTITQPPQLLVSCSAVAENCNDQDGAAFVSVNGGTGGYSYLWSNASVADSVQQLPSGNYQVWVTDQNGCVDSCSVYVATTSTVAADAGADVTIEQDQSVLLSANGGVSYFWEPAGLVNCATCQSVIATPIVTTTFVVTIYDAAGCVDWDTVVVTVEIPCDDIFVPNAFSPNGDGANDVLYLRGSCIAQFTFLVYNRWGELVFSTTDQSVGWDGRHRGEPCESAVFTYVARGLLTDGNVFEKKGNVTLVK